MESVAFNKDGVTLAAGDGNAYTYLWDTATKTITDRLREPNGASVTSVAFSPNGRTLATCDGYGSIYLWKVFPDTISTANAPAH